MLVKCSQDKWHIFYIKPVQLKFALGNVFNLYEALQENVEGDAWSKTGGYQKSNQGHKTTGNVIRHQLIVLFTSVFNFTCLAI